MNRLVQAVVLLAATLTLVGCGTKEARSTEAPKALSTNRSAHMVGLPEAWHPLALRLQDDGLYSPQMAGALLRIGSTPSQAPMGRKIKELYTKTFLRTPPQKPAPSKPVLRVYPQVITPANIALCRSYLSTHAAAFAVAEQRFGVPREIAAALLFVETRLGQFMGKESAFLTLASMATSSTPESIPDILAQLPGSGERRDWIAERTVQRSNWAYNELKALIVYLEGTGEDPLSVPGSIYGAIGLCQFMPSNLVPYGFDGNGDGYVNLFTPADAVASLSNYLVKNGWKKDASRSSHHRVLMRYNKSRVYAETILQLAEALKKAKKTPPASAQPQRKRT